MHPEFMPNPAQNHPHLLTFELISDVFSGFRMFQFSKLLLSFIAASSASLAAAAPVDLGLASQYNLVSFGDFASRNNSVAGNVAVAGNLSASGFSLSGKNLVVGGDLSYRNGSIAGNAYVGGSRDTSGIGFSGQWQSGASPLGFAALDAEMQALSTGLAGATATGSSKSQWGGLYLTGTQSPVEVFQLTSADFSASGWSNLSGLASGSTIVFNIGGSNVSLSNGMLGGLGNYNVLLNFYEAETLTLNGIGLDASILAPGATVLGANGNINGNVVVGNWNASVSLGAGRGFSATDVASYIVAQPSAPARPSLDLPSEPPLVAEVPEPGQLALMSLALVLAGLVTRRRKTRR